MSYVKCFSVTVPVIYYFNPKFRLFCTLMKTGDAAHSCVDPHSIGSLFFVFPSDILGEINKLFLWVTFLAETSKDLEIILIIIVLSFTNRLSRTSLYLSLKTSFVYSNLFSLAKLLKYYKYQLTKHCLEGRLEGFLMVS